MSYFDDQYEAWMANNCKGRIEDYDPFDADSWTGKPELRDDTPEEAKVLKQLKKAADGKGLSCFHHGNGHFQVVAGRLKINWYPLSKKETAHNTLTGEKRQRLQAKEVIAFALEGKAE